MNSIVKSIIEKIASKLGLTLYKKADIDYNYSDEGLNPTAIGANVLANIAVDDSDIIIEGSNARADAIRDYVDYFTDEIENTAVEVTLGTGDCIIRPFVQEGQIGINIIGNDNFQITRAVGGVLMGVVMLLDDYTTDKDTYRLFEAQELDGEICKISHFAFKGDTEISLDETSWAGIQEETSITANQLLLGRIKCPTINRNDYNSMEGVPITYGCEDIIENIQEKYDQYNDEFNRKKSRIFADRMLFKRDDNSDLVLTDSQEIIKLNGFDSSLSSMIETYSPSIREADYRNGNNFNLGILEMAAGLSRGVFTEAETSYATATEMKNSLKKTFSFVKRLRRRIEVGTTALFKAIDILMNINNTTPMGKWEIVFDWSYDYVEEGREKFEQLIQGNSIGAVSKAEVRSWTMNIPLDKAQAQIDEYEKENINEYSASGLDR